MSNHLHGGNINDANGIDARLTNIQSLLIGRNVKTKRDYPSEGFEPIFRFEINMMHNAVAVHINHGNIVIISIADEYVILCSRQRIWARSAYGRNTVNQTAHQMPRFILSDDVWIIFVRDIYREN